MSLKQLSALFIVCGSVALSACGGGGGSAGTAPPSPAVQSANVQGSAAKGLLLNAIVNFYPVSNGAAGATSLATVRTDSVTGGFSSPVAASGPVVVVVTTDSSTQMLDEIAGTAVPAPAGLTLHAALDGLVNLRPIAITPLTELAFVIAGHSGGGLTAANIDNANAIVSNVFLAGAPALYTQPIDLKHYAAATVAQQEQAKLLAALAVAASHGIATGAGGSACPGPYPANLVCLVAGLGDLLTLSSSGTPVLGSSVKYVVAAYQSLTAGTVTVEGGLAPGAFGLNVQTAAESGLLAAVGTQAPFPGGYNPNPGAAQADLVANTKALFANIRTNILDQSTSQTFGYSPTLTALQTDFNTNAGPVIADTASFAGGAYEAANLIQNGTSSTAGYGFPSQFISSPYALVLHGADVYVANGNATIGQLTATGGSTLYAGQPGVYSSVDGPALKASFTYIYGIAADASGNLYVTDNFSTIREITTAGVVSTLAGTSGVYGGNGGAAGQALFGGLLGIVVDSFGNIYAADFGNNVIWELSSGTVSVYAGQLDIPGSQDNGSSATSATFGCPSALAIDASNNIYVTDDCNFNIRVIAAGGGAVSTLAGQAGVYGYQDGPGASALFSGSIDALALAGNGDLYVYDAANQALRQITSAGVVSTVINGATQPFPKTGATIGNLYGLTASGGNLYAADYTYNSLQQITTAAAVSTLAHGSVRYSGHCGYDPVGLATATDVALCRYGLASNQILLTVTQTGATTYALKTQALQSDIDSNPASPTYGQCLLTTPYNQLTYCYVPNTSYPPLQSAFTWTTSATGAQSASLSGPYYVNASGGQVQGSLSMAESSNWNPNTYTGSISLSGTVSGGTGGISLVNMTIGSDSVITMQDLARLFGHHGMGLGSIAVAGDTTITLSGALDLTDLTTSAFAYAAKATIGAPVYDKTQELSLPGTVSLAGSINQITAGASTPLFAGTISAGVIGLPQFDATQPISATNNFTIQGQVSGVVDFPATGTLPARTLTVTASASGQPSPTTVPESMSVTYSYATPGGTTELNATGQYDKTNGFTGTLNDNAGVIVTLTSPVGGTLSGVVTDNGVETATISQTSTGPTINFTDGTTESVF